MSNLKTSWDLDEYLEYVDLTRRHYHTQKGLWSNEKEPAPPLYCRLVDLEMKYRGIDNQQVLVDKLIKFKTALEQIKNKRPQHAPQAVAADMAVEFQMVAQDALVLE